jgi:hypothetical protein
MNANAHNRNLTPFVCVMASNGLALVAFTFSPFAQEYPLAVLGIVAFLLVQMCVPACRPNVEAPLCPANLAQLFFWIQLVLVPLLIGFYGITPGTLPRLPSIEAMNTSIALRVLAYVCYCGGYQYFVRPAPRRADAGDDVGSPRNEAERWTIIAVFAAVGLVGWMLYYGGPSGFLELATSPIVQREREQEPTTLAVAAGNFLRHFLGFALVWAWSAWICRGKRRHSGLAVAGVTAGVIVLLLFANFSYNRGTMLAPILAVAAAYSAQVRRISFTLVGIAGAAVLAGAFTFGWYRSTSLQISEVSTEDIGTSWSDEQHLVDFVQIYASGPQLTGFLLDELAMDDKSYYGATLVPSLVYPVPVLGKPFREASGVFIFNELIYGDSEVLDQIIPYDAELYINFQVPGVVIIFVLLGGLQASVQNRFLHASAPIATYAWLLVGLWIIFPGSLAVTSQNFVYVLWPIYAYGAVKFFRFGFNSRGMGRVIGVPADVAPSETVPRPGIACST